MAKFMIIFATLIALAASSALYGEHGHDQQGHQGLHEHGSAGNTKTHLLGQSGHGQRGFSSSNQVIGRHDGHENQNEHDHHDCAQHGHNHDGHNHKHHH